MTPYEQAISALEKTRETLKLCLSSSIPQDEHLRVLEALGSLNLGLAALRSEASPLSDEVIAAGEPVAWMSTGRTGGFMNPQDKRWWMSRDDDISRSMVALHSIPLYARSSTPAVPRVRVEEIMEPTDEELIMRYGYNVPPYPTQRNAMKAYRDGWNDLKVRLTAMLREGEDGRSGGVGVAGNTPPVSSALRSASVLPSEGTSLQPPDAPSHELPTNAVTVYAMIPFAVILEDFGDAGWLARASGMPGVVVQGETQIEAMTEIDTSIKIKLAIDYPHSIMALREGAQAGKEAPKAVPAVSGGTEPSTHAVPPRDAPK